MLKHLFIEKIIENLDTLIEEIEDRDDRDDFANIISQFTDVREDLHELEEEDG